MNSPYATWQQFQRPPSAVPQLPTQAPVAPAAPPQPPAMPSARQPFDAAGFFNGLGSMIGRLTPGAQNMGWPQGGMGQTQPGQSPDPNQGSQGPWYGGMLGGMMGRMMGGQMPRMMGRTPWGQQAPQMPWGQQAPQTAPQAPQWGQQAPQLPWPRMEAPRPPQAPLDAAVSPNNNPSWGGAQPFARGGLACKCKG